MIIVIEGIDASGKATQAGMLRSKLGDGVAFYDFPHYQTPTGQLIRKVLKNNHSNTFEPVEWAMLLQSLMTTNRQEVQHILKPYAGHRNKHCLLDRYYASGLVYGEADGLPRDYLINIHSGLIPADIWLLVDISVDESFKRRPIRRDNYESRIDLLNRVRTGYVKLFTEQPNPFPGLWKIINGHNTDDMVHADIMTVVREFI